jgi:hypothetical protein
MRRTVTPAAAIATFVAAFSVGAGPAAAQEPEQGLVNVLGCALFGTGELEVLAGPTEGFINGWGTGTRGLAISYIRSQESTVTVQYDDQPATTLDLSDAYSTPVFNEEFGGCQTELVLPLGDLAAGDTVVVGIDLTLKTPAMDFLKGEGGYNFPPSNREHVGNKVPAGQQAQVTCTITVVAG